jgi:hypothetical protein
MLEPALWLAALLTGRLATIIATLAVAALGIALLRGVVPGRRALSVVLGCAIVTSAPAIAAALVGLAQPTIRVNDVVAYDGPGLGAPVPETYDPYAGAAVLPPSGPEAVPFR